MLWTLVKYALWLHCLQLFKLDERLKFYNAFKYYFQLCKFYCSICPLWQQNIQGFRYMTPRKSGVSAKLVEAGSFYEHIRTAVIWKPRIASWWINQLANVVTLCRVILSLEAPNSYHGSLPANIQRVCQSVDGWRTNYWVLPTTVQHVTLQMLACDKLKVFSRQSYLSKHFATQSSRSNACRLLSLGPTEGHSVQKYTPHNRKTQKTLYAKRFKSSTSPLQRKVFQNLEKCIQVCSEVKGDQFQHWLWAGPVLHRSRYVYINFQVIISIT
jgi:hypothetical protein